MQPFYEKFSSTRTRTQYGLYCSFSLVILERVKSYATENYYNWQKTCSKLNLNVQLNIERRIVLIIYNQRVTEWPHALRSSFGSLELNERPWVFYAQSTLSYECI